MRYSIIIIICVLILPSKILAKQSITIKNLLEKSQIGDKADRDKEAIAKVNGIKIYQDEFLRVLYASAGLRVLRQFIGLKLAKQLASQKGIKLDKADFDKEMITLVNTLGPNKGVKGKELTYNDRLHLLSIVLRRKGISYEEFFIGIKMQTYLKAIAKKEIKITDKMLEREYQKIYGEKLDIRAIVVTSFKSAETILQKLQQGEEFSKLAIEYSIVSSGPTNGGLIKNVSRYDNRLPALVLNCAFKLSAGQVSSSIKVDENYWIIKIEKKMPGKQVKYETVKRNLQNKLRKELEMEMARQLEKDLFRRADIEIYNKQLAKEFANWRENVLTGTQGR